MLHSAILPQHAKYNLSREGLKKRAKRTCILVISMGILGITLNSIKNWWKN
jgi:hypothetical protein